MKLLIDLGNTRLKWATCNRLEITQKPAILNTDLNRNVLKQMWQTIDAPRHLAISCVGSNTLFDLVITVIVELWPEISISREKSQASRFGITNAYLEPEKLGVDRWLAMIAGYHTYHKAICIVSCGTAITLDIVDDKGKHQGGLISPGLRLMQESLAKNTENLELSDAGYSFGLANYTAAAIHNGTLSAACGLIELTLSNLHDSLQLVLTGGDAEIIAQNLSRPYIIDRELVLRGLALTLIESQ
jgi:type III pantothenate kinase